MLEYQNLHQALMMTLYFISNGQQDLRSWYIGREQNSTPNSFLEKHIVPSDNGMEQTLRAKEMMISGKSKPAMPRRPFCWFLSSRVC